MILLIFIILVQLVELKKLFAYNGANIDELVDGGFK